MELLEFYEKLGEGRGREGERERKRAWERESRI